MKYAWRQHSFDVPDGLIDQTSLVLVKAEGAEVAYSLTVARDATGDALKGYVDATLRDLATSLSGFRLQSRDDKATLAGKPASRLVHTSTTPEGQAIVQHQGIAKFGGGIVVVTAAAPEGKDGPAKAAFEALWKSWQERP